MTFTEHFLTSCVKFKILLQKSLFDGYNKDRDHSHGQNLFSGYSERRDHKRTRNEREESLENASRLEGLIMILNYSGGAIETMFSIYHCKYPGLL